MRRIIIKCLHHPKGMTLIEMLVVVAISALIMIALLSLYMTGQKYFFNQNAKADAMQDSRFSMASISRDIRESTGIHTAPVVVDGTSYSTNNNDCLVLEVNPLKVDGDFNPPIVGVVPIPKDYIVYSHDVNTSKLYRIVIPDAVSSRRGGSRVVADNVSVLSLSYFIEDGSTTASPFSDAFIVDITLIASQKGVHRSGQPFNEELRTRAQLRNKVLPVPA